jgi:hypothetical protein
MQDDLVTMQLVRADGELGRWDQQIGEFLQHPIEISRDPALWGWLSRA